MAPLGLYDRYVTYHHGSLASRFLLYPDGTFELQFASPRYGFFEYRGRWVRQDSLVAFDWDGWSLAGPWEAHGTITDAQLSVKYNMVMLMIDFVDGVYVREPDAR